MSASRIAATFRNQFRVAGKIQASNVSRDLKKAKKQTPALVQGDETNGNVQWYLIDNGIKYAEQLVAEARGLDIDANDPQADAVNH